MLTRAQKTEQVGELKEKFARATSVYVADYRGLDVQAMNSLRRKIRTEGRGDYEYRVAKNTILRRAADGSKVAEIAAHFEGPTVIALSYGDPVGLARILTEFATADFQDAHTLAAHYQDIVGAKATAEVRG